jgi:molecular chaperone DnaJ
VKDYYKILGLAPSATDEEIKSAGRKLLAKNHPDVNPSPEAKERYIQIKEAYETLSDPRRRAEYDKARKGGGPRAQSPPGAGRPGTAPRAGRQPHSAPGVNPQFDLGSFLGGMFGGAAAGAAGQRPAGARPTAGAGTRPSAPKTTPGRKYYQILQVPETATDEEIDAAYKRLAREWHPDKHPDNPQQAQQKFIEIKEAYEAIKQIRSGAEPPPDQEESAPSAGGRSAAPSQGDLSIEITLEEAFGGGMRTQKVQTYVTCLDCRGAGFLADRKMCATCRGAGTRRREEEVPVNIPAGIYDGAKLRVKGKGPINAQGQRGDLFLTVRIKPHPIYEREGSDLVMEVEVPYTVMVLGGQTLVKTLAGEKPLVIPEGTQSGQRLRIAGMGLPGLRDRPAGDLYVRPKVAIPKQISNLEHKILLELARLRNDPVKM